MVLRSLRRPPTSSAPLLAAFRLRAALPMSRLLTASHGPLPEVSPMGCRIVRTIAMGSRSGGVPGAVLIHRPRTGRDNVGEMRRPLLPIIPQNTCCCGTICQLFRARARVPAAKRVK